MIIALIGSPLSGKTTILKKLKEKGMRYFLQILILVKYIKVEKKDII